MEWQIYETQITAKLAPKVLNLPKILRSLFWLPWKFLGTSSRKSAVFAYEMPCPLYYLDVIRPDSGQMKSHVKIRKHFFKMTVQGKQNCSIRCVENLPLGWCDFSAEQLTRTKSKHREMRRKLSFFWKIMLRRMTQNVEPWMGSFVNFSQG